jgi:hypothetical protein
MTLKGKTNHYNIKILKGYGFSISVKDSKIVLKNTADPFKEPEVEEWFWQYLSNLWRSRKDKNLKFKFYLFQNNSKK